MDRTVFISALVALLLLSIASTSSQQIPPPNVNSSIPELKPPSRGTIPSDSGLPTSKGALVSPPPSHVLGDSSLSVSPQPPPPTGNSLRSPSPPLPAHSLGNSPAAPSLGSPPPPPIEASIQGGALEPNGTGTGAGDGKEKGCVGVSFADDEEARKCMKYVVQCDSLDFCLLDPRKDTKKQLLVVHNKGKSPLNVSIVELPSTTIKSVTLCTNKIEKMELASDITPNCKVVPGNGKTGCRLSAGPPPQPPFNLFQQFPAYATRLTPVYAACAILFTVLLAGGSWACCSLRKRARQVNAGIPYRQLEMGMQTQPSYTADTSTTAEGWDQGWSDDWDDEEAATGLSRGRTASSNGTVATKSSAKDGWEDWDD